MCVLLLAPLILPNPIRCRACSEKLLYGFGNPCSSRSRWRCIQVGDLLLSPVNLPASSETSILLSTTALFPSPLGSAGADSFAYPFCHEEAGQGKKGRKKRDKAPIDTGYLQRHHFPDDASFLYNTEHIQEVSTHAAKTLPYLYPRILLPGGRS